MSQVTANARRGLSAGISPLFVLGCARSGTTMLAGLLHESPWGRAFETHFIAKYYRKLARYGDLSQRENCTRLARAIMSERPAQSWKLNVDYDKFCESLIRRDYPHIVDGLCCAHTARKGHISWGDKTPHYLLQLDIIQRLFPESKIVYIVRDGRDTALSLMRTAWGPANVYAAAAYWKLCNASGPVIDQLRAQGQWLQVRYEDLLDHPRESLAQILDYLQEDWPAEKLNRIITDIRRSNHSKWRSEMTPRQIQTFERVAGDTLRRFGYEAAHDEAPISSFLRSCFVAQDRAKHSWNLFELNVIDTIKIRFFGKEPFNE